MANVYVTAQGDTFDSIAYWLYGDEKYMKDLIECNWDYADVLVFGPDVTLYIPEVDLDEEDDEDMPFWRDEDEDDEEKSEDDYYEYDEDAGDEDLTDEESEESEDLDDDEEEDPDDE